MPYKRPANKRKWRQDMQQRMNALTPRQRTLYFTELQKEQSDQFFEMHFTKLFLEVRRFVLDVFGTEALEGARSLWRQDYPDEFLNVVKKIARPGSDGSQWESLLKDGTLRSALIQGVIMMLLDVNVFSSLLFGATWDHKKLLGVEDVTMVDFDGFSRTSLRTETNNTYLQSKLRCGNPPLFWAEVDRLATQIMHLLIHVYTAVGEGVVSDVTDPFLMYQKMHDIVAYAGWLNVAMRLSHKIMAFEWIHPGEAHLEPQTCIAEEPRRNDGQQRSGRSRSRVMISIAPKITRYDRETASFLSGKKTYTVMRPQVACYSGQWVDWEDEDAMVPLESYIHGGKPSLAGRPPPSSLGFLFVLGLAILCILWMPDLWKLEITHRTRGFRHLITSMPTNIFPPHITTNIVVDDAMRGVEGLIKMVDQVVLDALASLGL